MSQFSFHSVYTSTKLYISEELGSTFKIFDIYLYVQYIHEQGNKVSVTSN